MGLLGWLPYLQQYLTLKVLGLQVLFLATGIITSLGNQMVFYQGAGSPTQILLALPLAECHPH